MTNSLTHFWNQLQASSFLKKAGIVAFGTIIAQGILILFVPFLSRIYTVEQFGLLGIFMLVGMFGIQLLTWRFDYGIASAETADSARNILSLCMVTAIGSTIIYGVLLLLLEPALSLKGGFEIKGYLVWILFYGYSGSIWNAFTLYNIRMADYKLNAGFTILRALLIVITSFLMQDADFNGLIAGLVTGQLFATMLLVAITTRQMPVPFWGAYGFSVSSLLNTAKSSAGFLKYSFPSAAIELFSGQLPQFFIGTFGATGFGWFSQANRLLNAPLDLLGQSIRAVFWETGSKQFRQEGQCIVLFDKIMFRLAGFSILPFILLFWLAPWLFGFVLGQGWEEAGHFARLLVPLCFFRFISNPLSSMFYIAEKQRYDFSIQAIVLLLVIVLYFFPGLGIHRVESAIMLYSAIYSCKYLAELWFSRQFAIGSKQS